MTTISKRRWAIVAGICCALFSAGAFAFADAPDAAASMRASEPPAHAAADRIGAPVVAQRAPVSDEDIVERIIKDSIARYPGNCACPFQTDRAGRSCGRRSAYSRGGGYAPICFESDVTPEMIKKYRAKHTS